MVSVKRFVMVILVAGSVSTAQAGQLQQSAMRKSAMNGECTFSLVDPFSGRLEKSGSAPVGEQHASYLAHIKKGRYIQDLVIYFGCEEQGDLEKICKEMANIEFNNDRWVLAPPSELNREAQSSYADSVSLSLNEKGARGGAYLASDASGPVQFRQRSLSFCVSNGNAVVWGSSIVDSAPYSEKKSTEPEAIRLIRSIKFDH